MALWWFGNESLFIDYWRTIWVPLCISEIDNKCPYMHTKMDHRSCIIGVVWQMISLFIITIYSHLPSDIYSREVHCLLHPNWNAGVLVCFRQPHVWFRRYKGLFWHSICYCWWICLSTLGLTISSFSRNDWWRFPRGQCDCCRELLPYSWCRKMALVLYYRKFCTIPILQFAWYPMLWVLTVAKQQ